MALGLPSCHPLAVPEERLIDDRLPTGRGLFDELGSSPLRQRMLAIIGARGTRRRLRALVLAVVLLVLLSGGVGTGLALRHRDRQYGPLEEGNFFGPCRDTHFELLGKSGAWL